MRRHLLGDRVDERLAETVAKSSAHDDRFEVEQVLSGRHGLGRERPAAAHDLPVAHNDRLKLGGTEVDTGPYLVVGRVRLRSFTIPSRSH
jgi:hypothetical protein